jgi:hypothetical protein
MTEQADRQREAERRHGPRGGWIWFWVFLLVGLVLLILLWAWPAPQPDTSEAPDGGAIPAAVIAR